MNARFRRSLNRCRSTNLERSCCAFAPTRMMFRRDNQIAAVPSAVVREVPRSNGVPESNPRLKRLLRFLRRWLFREPVQWIRSIGAHEPDGCIHCRRHRYCCGLSVRAVRMAIRYLSAVVAGRNPSHQGGVSQRWGRSHIDHPVSRWFLRSSLRIAHFRSYRDQASRDCLEGIGFDTSGDVVCPDVVFGLSQDNLPQRTAGGGRRPVIGLGLKDYGSADSRHTGSRREFLEYLRTMAEFISWSYAAGYSVRLLIGDMRFDNPVVNEFVGLLNETRHFHPGADVEG